MSDAVPEKKRAMAVVRDMTIRNERGFHARPATEVARIAFAFDGDITIEKDGTKVSAKSVMGLLGLEAGRGTKIKVSAEGPGAESALNRIEEVIKKKFEDV